MTTNIGILLFDQVEVLDFAGPYEVFTTASRVHQRADENSRLLNVFTLAQSSTIKARAGLVVLPDFNIQHHPDIHVLIIPGGVITAEQANPEVINWIGQCSQRAIITASVCTGAFLLAAAGVITHQRVTTHWEDITDLRAQFPNLTVVENTRWLDAGKIITSAGISAGIDMSLHLVSRLASHDLAIKTARQMEFDWSPTAG